MTKKLNNLLKSLTHWSNLFGKVWITKLGGSGFDSSCGLSEVQHISDKILGKKWDSDNFSDVVYPDQVFSKDWKTPVQESFLKKVADHGLQLYNRRESLKNNVFHLRTTASEICLEYAGCPAKKYIQL